MATGLDAQKNALKALENDFTATYPQALEQLEKRVEAALTAAETTIKDLESKATELTDGFIAAAHGLRDTIDQNRQATDEHVKTLTASLGDAKQHVDDASKKRQSDFADLQATLTQLETAFTKIESDSKSALDNVLQHAQPLVQLVAQGTAAVHDHSEQIGAALGQTHVSFAQEVQTMIQALDQMAQHIEQEHTQHDGDHEQQAQSTHQHTTDLIKANLDTMSQGMSVVGNAFSVLGEFSTAFGGSFGDGAGALLHTVQEIEHLVDAIKPVLDVIKAIE